MKDRVVLNSGADHEYRAFLDRREWEAFDRFLLSGHRLFGFHERTGCETVYATMYAAPRFSDQCL